MDLCVQRTTRGGLVEFQKLAIEVCGSEKILLSTQPDKQNLEIVQYNKYATLSIPLNTASYYLPDFGFEFVSDRPNCGIHGYKILDW